MDIKELKSSIQNICSSESTGNLFELLGLQTNELSHSRVIAFLLAPNGKLLHGNQENDNLKISHKYGSKFLDLFIRDVIGYSYAGRNGHQSDVENAKVYIEYPFDDGRLDIFIDCNGKYGIAIENKINAADQEKQLKRYFDFLNAKYKGERDLVYLTLDGRKASESSKEDLTEYINGSQGKEYLCRSYSNESQGASICSWLKNCVKIIDLNDSLLNLVKIYIETIEKLNYPIEISTQINDFGDLSCIDQLLKDVTVKEKVNDALDLYLYRDIYEKGIKKRFENIKKTNEELYFEDNICYLYLFTDKHYEYDIVFIFNEGKVRYLPICIEHKGKNNYKWWCWSENEGKWTGWNNRSNCGKELQLSEFINYINEEAFKEQIKNMRANIIKK